MPCTSFVYDRRVGDSTLRLSLLGSSRRRSATAPRSRSTPVRRRRFSPTSRSSRGGTAATRSRGCSGRTTRPTAPGPRCGERSRRSAPASAAAGSRHARRRLADRDGLQLDVDEFRRLAAADGLARAGAAGLHAASSSPVRPPRQRPPSTTGSRFQAEDAYARELAAVLDRIAEQVAPARGERPRAQSSTAQRRLALDPLNESAHRRLMQAVRRERRAERGAPQYRECVRTLHRELGVAPTEATTAAYRADPGRVRRRTPESAGKQAPPEPMPPGTPSPAARMAVGGARRRPIGSRPGRPPVVVLEGEAGIGKTRPRHRARRAGRRPAGRPSPPSAPSRRNRARLGAAGSSSARRPARAGLRRRSPDAAAEASRGSCRSWELRPRRRSTTRRAGALLRRLALASARGDRRVAAPDGDRRGRRALARRLVARVARLRGPAAARSCGAARAPWRPEETPPGIRDGASSR